MKRTIDLNELFKHAPAEIMMHITALHKFIDNMPEEKGLTSVGIIPPCKTNPTSGRREFDWQVAVDLKEELSYLTNQLPMVVHAIKPDEGLQMLKLVNLLRECAVVIVPDDIEENLESVYLASECDGMVVSYSNAKAAFKQNLNNFNRIQGRFKELKERLN